MHETPKIFFYQSNGLPADKKEEAFYWKVGNMWGIVNFTLATQIRAILKLAAPIGPVVFQELAFLQQDFEAIWHRALLVGAYERQLGHLVSSLEDWRQTPAHLRPIPTVREAFEQLAFSMNSEFILYLVKLFDPELEKAIDQINVEATEQYTLLAYLREFRTEIASLLLQNRLAKLKILKKQQLQSVADPNLEKEVAKLRRELSENIQSLKLILKNIVSFDAPLGDLRKQCELLDLSLKPQNWVDQQIIWHLLLKRFDVKSITVSQWNEKAALQAALLISLDQYINQQGEERILRYLQKQSSLPERLCYNIRKLLKHFNILPGEPYGKHNPDLSKLLT